MTWIAKNGDISIRHILTTDKSRSLWPENLPDAYAEALCGVELNPLSDGRSGLPCCETCAETNERNHPRRTYHSGKKLPRCKCPTCGGVHIKERDHVNP